MYASFKSRSSNTTSSSSRYNDKSRDRYYSIGTGLIDEEEFKFGKNSIKSIVTSLKFTLIIDCL